MRKKNCFKNQMYIFYLKSSKYSLFSDDAGHKVKHVNQSQTIFSFLSFLLDFIPKFIYIYIYIERERERERKRESTAHLNQ